MGIKIGLPALWMSAMMVCTLGQQDVHLLVLSTDASGRAIISVAGQHRSYNHTYPFTDGEHVSPACSASGRSTRCQKLQVVGSGQRRVVLVPLQNAVGLMELQYDERRLFKVQDITLSITDAFLNDNCVPLDIIRFEDRLIVMCLENLQNLKSCDIDIDQANISQSVLTQCVQLLSLNSPIAEADYRYISNFALFPDQTQILFAVRGNIYHIRIRRQTGQFYYSLSDVSCDRLQYAGNHIFYAYCALGQTKRYYPDSENARGAGPFIPFACPQSDETLSETFFEVQQTEHDTVVRYGGIDYRTAGLNFTTGDCYDSDTLFLVDSVEGTKAFRQSLGSFYIISSSSSRDRNLVVFNGPYIVVYQINPAEVVLYGPSFLRIMDISKMALAVGIVTTGFQMQTHTSSGPQTITPTLTVHTAPTAPLTATFSTTPVPTVSPILTAPVSPTPLPTTAPAKAGSDREKIGIGVGVGVTLGLIITIIMIVVILVYIRKRRQKNSYKVKQASMNRREFLLETDIHSDPETQTEAISQSSSGEGAALVSENRSLPPANSFSQVDVAKTYAKRTDTEDKRNNMQHKVQAMPIN